LINLVHKIREILSAILVHPVTNNKLYFQDQNSGLPKEKTTNERERYRGRERERERLMAMEECPYFNTNYIILAKNAI
jgi:hypothetical protein